MKLMKTQGASDAMQMAHYKLTIIITIIITNMTVANNIVINFGQNVSHIFVTRLPRFPNAGRSPSFVIFNINNVSHNLERVKESMTFSFELFHWIRQPLSRSAPLRAVLLFKNSSEY